jgi:zinc protease
VLPGRTPVPPLAHRLDGGLDAAHLDDIALFFRTYYTPDNAVLSIAGDFEPSEARELVRKQFGAIPRGKGRPPLGDMTVAPVFGEPPREVVPDDVMLPRLFMACRTPVFGTDAYYAASICASILGVRRGSRLQRNLVRDRQVAAEAGAFTYDLTKGSDLLVIDVTARPEVEAERLEAEVHRELDELHARGVEAQEVERARTGSRCSPPTSAIRHS